jgi:hypothetical protein
MKLFLQLSPLGSFKVEHLEEAFAEACSSGLSAVDAIHIVVAAGSGCDEIVTSEKPNKAIHRTTLVPVVSIDTE